MLIVPQLCRIYCLLYTFILSGLACRNCCFYNYKCYILSWNNYYLHTNKRKKYIINKYQNKTLLCYSFLSCDSVKKTPFSLNSLSLNFWCFILKCLNFFGDLIKKTVVNKNLKIKYQIELKIYISLFLWLRFMWLYIDFLSLYFLTYFVLNHKQ